MGMSLMQLNFRENVRSCRVALKGQNPKRKGEALLYDLPNLKSPERATSVYLLGSSYVTLSGLFL